MEPILLYDSESWPARGRDLSKISASELKCLRRISGKTKRDLIKNQKIREDLQQPPIEKRLAQRQLRWFFLHLINEDRNPRQVFEERPDGGRPRGRPRVTYEECIEEMGRGGSIQKHGGT